MLPSVSASATEAPPCSRPNGWWGHSPADQVRTDLQNLNTEVFNQSPPRALIEGCGRDGTHAYPTHASAHPKDARTPTARVAFARIATAAAVASAEVAFAAIVHTLDQFVAACFKEVLACEA